VRIPENKIQEISDRASIVDIVGEYVSLKQKGDTFWGCCPFHNEKTASFTVTESKNMFYCFGCQKGGSIFNFIMEIEHMSFFDSVLHLGSKTGVQIDLTDNVEDEVQASKRDSLLNMYEKSCGSFSYILNNVESAVKAKEYLLGRGFSKQIIDEFRIGYAPAQWTWLYNFFKSKSYSDEFLRYSGFFSKKSIEVSIFVDRVMFPVINQHNQVVAFSGRALSEGGPKYINSPETIIYHKGSTLFGINLALKEIRKSKTFLLCEGNLDVVALHQVGLSNAVAPLGTAFTEPQAKLLKRYADKGIIMFDGDSAGIKATEKACIILERVGIAAQVVSLGSGLDPADILKESGAEALINVCKCTINSFDYLLEKLLDNFGRESPESKESVAKGMLPYINSIISDVRKEACLKNLASELGISELSVLNELASSNRKPQYKRHEPKHDVIDIYIDKELFLMCALVINCEFYDKVRLFVEEYSLISSNAITVFNAISSSLKDGVSSIESIIRRVDSAELSKLLTSICASNEFDDNPGGIIIDSLFFLKKKAILKKIREIESGIANFRPADGSDVLSDLLHKKAKLDEELVQIEG